jgi:hypothetical protein
MALRALVSLSYLSWSLLTHRTPPRPSGVHAQQASPAPPSSPAALGHAPGSPVVAVRPVRVASKPDSNREGGTSNSKHQKPVSKGEGAGI